MRYLTLLLLLATACAAEVVPADVDVGELGEQLTLANVWTSINSNNGAPLNETNRLCRTIRVYVMQFPAQWSCTCSDFMNNPSCQNATAWLGIANAACAGQNCAQTVGFIKQGGPFGLQYRASFTIQNGGGSDMVPMWEMKPEATPSQELTGEIFRGYWSTHRLERWVP